jgi:CheY-like chemotaxis protein
VKKITADFLRQEITRLGAVVVETAIYHPSGQKLHRTGDALTLAHAKFLREAFLSDLHVAEFDEDLIAARKALGIQRVIPGQVAAGDVLAEDIRNLNHELVVAAGKPLTAEDLERVRGANVLAVAIQHRELAKLTEAARRYLALASPPGEESRESLARGTRMTHKNTVTVRYPLIPRAKVAVVAKDDLLRTFLVNAVLSAGHEVLESPSGEKLLDLLEPERPHVAVLGFEAAQDMLTKIRQRTVGRSVMVIVCLPGGKAGLQQEALLSGANDTLPRPPSRDALQDKIQGCQGVLGRRVLLPPSLKADRRRAARPAVKIACRLRDPEGGRTLPVQTAEIIDRGPGGFRIDYNLPQWPEPWAYLPHGVHPRHFFYAYAAANPEGRPLSLVLAGEVGPLAELPVRVVHAAPAISPHEELEVLGLRLANGPGAPPPAAAPPRRAF